ncbi:MAG: polysaccharide deacetylase family protein, partial [Planctomycetes bacterium]|nr:polysaccharide deacetylase family protein [Planctomycetota bacterium]
MDLLKSHGFKILALDDALKDMYNNHLPSNSAVITVDDGFQSTFRLFYPIIKQFNYPATVYVTTYYVEKQNPIFRIVVQYMFWKTRLSYLRVDKPLWGKNVAVSVDLTDSENVKRISQAIIDFGENNSTEQQRQIILHELGALLAVNYKDIIESQAFTLMSGNEIRQLSQHGIDIQLHTHRHYFPNNKNIAIKEIEENAAYLSTLVSNELRHFCYPSGIWSQNQWQWLES